jgi:hypothetical protein
MKAKKKAAELAGGQQPQKDMSQVDNVALKDDEVKYFESLILKDMYQRDYAAGNWQSHHYA